jgi:hypothetical protein
MLIVAAATGSRVRGAMTLAAGTAVPPVPGPAARRTRPGTTPNAIIAALLAVVVLAALPWWRVADPLTGRRGLLTYAPSGLAVAQRSVVAPGARVVVPQTWGSWFEWAVPGALYLVDARFELFPAAVWSDLDAIDAGGAGAATILDRWHVDALVLPAGAPEPAGAWTKAYADADGEILVRATAPPVAVVEPGS